MKLFRFLAILLVVTPPLRASAAEQPLGQNLAYRRVHALPDDLPVDSGSPKKGLVLDLRFARATDHDAATFAAWLRFYARPQSPVFVLANGQTDRALLAPLVAAQKLAGVISIGPAQEGMNWDVPVKVASEADRVAYDLFEHGTPLDRLIVRKVEKVRRDEASMARNGTGEATESEADPAAPAPASPAEAKPPAAEPPLDLVLQRAVQLHRALLALKKIPSG